MKTKRKLIPKTNAVSSSAGSGQHNVVGQSGYDNVCPSVSPNTQCAGHLSSLPYSDGGLEVFGLPDVALSVPPNSRCTRQLNSSSFRVQWSTVCEKIQDVHIPNFKVRLYNVIGTREYELPTRDMLGVIFYDPGLETDMDYDIILEERSGEGGLFKRSENDLSYWLLFQTKARRLFQQYVVTAFCAIEHNRIDYICEHQNDIRNEYLFGIYDAINRGDSDGYDCGSRLILPQSFTGGSHFMYSHYLDALAICRVHGNPSFFITYTSNVKWPKITEYMDQFLLLTTTDRADVLDRVFEMKIHQLMNFLRDAQRFGKTVAVLYTVEFQKRGLPHCHTLLWIDESARVRKEEDIDVYISAELPPEDVDPECYRVVLELMMHGPCGLAYPSASFQILAVHLQNMQRVVFKERDGLDSVVLNTHKKKTTLTERPILPKDATVSSKRL
ncbi:DNA helicase [Tanacetum coccineum]